MFKSIATATLLALSGCAFTPAQVPMPPDQPRVPVNASMPVPPVSEVMHG